MQRFIPGTRWAPALRWSSLALLAGVFLIDLATPRGYAEWALYALPLGLTMLQDRVRLPLWIAAAASVLILGGLFLSPGGVSLEMAAISRSLYIVVLWALALVTRQVLVTRLRVAELLWLQQGETSVSQALLGLQQGEQIATHASAAVCRWLHAPVAVVYGFDSGLLRRLGGHGAELAALPAQLHGGEGLLGMAVAAAQQQWIDDVPTGHLSLVSGLGRSEPAALVLTPLLAEGQVCGVLELGLAAAVARDEAARRRIGQLLQQVAEPIGMALQASLYRQRLVALLEETRRQGEELQQQQEELRAANEELEQQSEVLRESNDRLQDQQSELEQGNAQLAQQASQLQRQREDLLHAQDALQLHAEQLEAASRYKSEFLANMSHELRTPLNSALILSKLLADNREGTLSAEQVKYARAIHASNNDLLALINDILDLSKIEAGHVDLQPEPVELSALLETMQRTFEPLVQHKGLQFEMQAEPGAPTLLTTDRTRVQQVLKNLLANAVKFTEHGSVTLTSRRAGDVVEIEVRDTGIGLSAADQARIVEPFWQAERPITRRVGGTGLGLTITRHLVELLGGEIHVESEAGVGSTFTVRLPIG
jgi:signal transduction histidine kinase